MNRIDLNDRIAIVVGLAAAGRIVQSGGAVILWDINGLWDINKAAIETAVESLGAKASGRVEELTDASIENRGPGHTGTTPSSRPCTN